MSYRARYSPPCAPIRSQGFVREMRVAAAIKWYETGMVSQSKGAEIAGVSRAEFMNALNHFKVNPFQYTADEIVAEITHR